MIWNITIQINLKNYFIEKMSDITIPDDNELLYDVELSNGDKLLGLTIQEVNSLSSKYELIFASSISLSNS